jgi:hypothetical protein
VSVLGGTIALAVGGRTFLSHPIAVTATQYELPFHFDADVDGLDASLAIELEVPTPTLIWTVGDGVVNGWEREALVCTIRLDELDLRPTGIYALKGDDWSAEVPPRTGTDGWVRVSKKTGEIIK